MKHHIDILTDQKLTGWAFSEDIAVKYLLIKDSSIVYEGVANIYRKDLEVYFGDSGFHGFDIQFKNFSDPDYLVFFDGHRVVQVDLKNMCVEDKTILPWRESFRCHNSENAIFFLEHGYVVSCMFYFLHGVFLGSITPENFTLTSLVNNSIVFIKGSFDKPFMIDDEFSFLDALVKKGATVFFELPCVSTNGHVSEPDYQLVTLGKARYGLRSLTSVNKLLDRNFAYRFLAPSDSYGPKVSCFIYKLNNKLPCFLFVSGRSGVGKSSFSRLLVDHCSSEDQLILLDVFTSNLKAAEDTLPEELHGVMAGEVLDLPHIYSSIHKNEAILDIYIKELIRIISPQSGKIVIEGAAVNEIFAERFKELYGEKSGVYWFARSV